MNKISSFMATEAQPQKRRRSIYADGTVYDPVQDSLV
jgi:hypothetical protein